MDKKGFTLIELLIVVAIIGILAAISIPIYNGQQRRAAAQEAYANLESIRVLAEQFYAENGRYELTAGNGPEYNFSAAMCPNDPAGDQPACIRSLLRGFRPGNSADLKFTYSYIACGTGGRGACAIVGGIAVASCVGGAAPDDQNFVACAGGKPGTIAGGSAADPNSGQLYWLNNLNQRNW